MAWYDVSLREREVQQLDTLFSVPPYHFQRGIHTTETIAFVHHNNQNIPFMSYDAKRIVVHHGAIKVLPERIKVDLEERLGQVPTFSRLMRTILAQNR